MTRRSVSVGQILDSVVAGPRGGNSGAAMEGSGASTCVMPGIGNRVITSCATYVDWTNQASDRRCLLERQHLHQSTLAKMTRKYRDS